MLSLFIIAASGKGKETELIEIYCVSPKAFHKTKLICKMEKKRKNLNSIDVEKLKKVSFIKSFFCKPSEM